MVKLRVSPGQAAMRAPAPWSTRARTGTASTAPVRRRTFGFTPLYIGEAEVKGAVDILADIIGNRLWDREDLLQRKAVT